MVGVRHLDQVGVDAFVAQGLRERPGHCGVDGGVPGAVDDGDGDLVVLLVVSANGSDCAHRCGRWARLPSKKPRRNSGRPRPRLVEVDRTGEGDQRVRPQRAAGGVARAFGRRDLFRRQGDHRAGPAAERVTDQNHAVRVAAVVRPDGAGHADGAGDVLERRRPAATLVPVLPPDGLHDHGVVHGDREPGVHHVALVGQRVGPAGDEQHDRSGARCRRCQHVHRELTGGADVVARDVRCEGHSGPARQLGGGADVAAAGVDREDLVRRRCVARAGRGRRRGRAAGCRSCSASRPPASSTIRRRSRPGRRSPGRPRARRRPGGGASCLDQTTVRVAG